MATRERRFSAATATGDLVGTVRPGPGGAPNALVLHGGPGLSDYTAGIVDELDPFLTTARYQQRGIDPSTVQGERDVETHVADAVAVLDALGWEQAVVIGHSWGGHLALHFCVAHPERTQAVVAVDPLGAIGDGGMADMDRRLKAQLSPKQLARADEISAKPVRTDAERNENLQMLWPYYFGTPANAPPYPGFRFDIGASRTWASIEAHLTAGTLQRGLATFAKPLLVIHGDSSPIPISQAEATAALVPSGELVAIPGVGHFGWLEQPGVIGRAIAEFLARRLIT